MTENVIVAAFSGRIFGLDARNGEVIWEHELDTAGNPIALLITADAIYAATFHNLACLHYPSGRRVWSVPTRIGGRATLLLEGDRLLVGKNGEVECFTLAGESSWHNGFKGKGIGPVSLGVPGNVAQADESG
jgi:outer membrane protein assembly factor BamB